MSLPGADTAGSQAQDTGPRRMPGTGWAGRHPRMAPVLGLTAIAAAGTLLAYFRVPGISAGTVWAEDGALFLREYLEKGPALLDPYAGYLHLLPRTIVATVAPTFGLEAYPAAVTAACSLVLGLSAALTFYCASAVTAGMAARLCWASIPVLVAPGALETMGNLANLHWYLLWLTPWVLMKAPPRTGPKILLGAAALVITLSEIQALFFFPLLLWRIRDRRLWWARTGFVAGAACQLSTLATFPRGREDTAGTADVLSVVYGYFLNSTAAIAFGSSSAISHHVQAFGMAPILLSAVPFAVAAFLIARWGSRMQRMAGLVWVLASVVIWTAAVLINPTPAFSYSDFRTADDWDGFFLSRYSAVPSMFLLALIPLLISGLPGRDRHSAHLVAGRRVRGAALGAFMVLQSVYYFPIDGVRLDGPEWSAQIRAARQACGSDPSPERVEVPQAPEGWVTPIRCSDL